MQEYLEKAKKITGPFKGDPTDLYGEGRLIVWIHVCGSGLTVTRLYFRSLQKKRRKKEKRLKKKKRETKKRNLSKPNILTQKTKRKNRKRNRRNRNFLKCIDFPMSFQ